MGEVTAATHIAAPPGRVFDAWLDPGLAGRFFFGTQDGQIVESASDPVEGGRFHYVDRRPTLGDVRHEGVYEVLDRPRRLVLSFSTPQFNGPTTRVSLDFVNEYGGCHLTIRQDGVEPKWDLQTRQGWGVVLELLRRELG